MNQDQTKTYEAVLRILRMAGQACNADNVRAGQEKSEESLDESRFSRILNERISDKKVGEVVSKSIYGFGMVFVALFTSAITMLMPLLEDKLMFAGFAVVCLFIGVHQLDAASRWIQGISILGAVKPE